jgi:hypothetical protein
VGKGDTAREFVMPIEALANRSKALSKAIEELNEEGAEMTIKLPKQDPTTFAIYEGMVRTGKAPCIDNEIDGLFRSESEPVCSYYHHYCKSVFERLCHAYNSLAH